MNDDELKIETSKKKYKKGIKTIYIKYMPI